VASKPSQDAFELALALAGGGLPLEITYIFILETQKGDPPNEDNPENLK
jgi:hypothetical protein